MAASYAVRRVRDVDYLPVWTDYSLRNADPDHLVWHAQAAIRVNRRLALVSAQRKGLGAVTLFSTGHFRLVNGYSNRFFGGGGEDDDLTAHCNIHDLEVLQRNCTFIALDDNHAGFR